MLLQPLYIPHTEQNLSLNLYYNLGTAIILKCGVLLTPAPSSREMNRHIIRMPSNPTGKHIFLLFHSYDMYSSTQARDFSLLQSVHTRSGGHSASYSVGIGFSFPEGKAARSEAGDYLYPVLKLSMRKAKPQTHLPPPICLHSVPRDVTMSGLRLFVYDKLHLPSVPSCSHSSSSFIIYMQHCCKHI
jgi:hypothetical protein